MKQHPLRTRPCKGLGDGEVELHGWVVALDVDSGVRCFWDQRELPGLWGPRERAATYIKVKNASSQPRFTVAGPEAFAEESYGS